MVPPYALGLAVNLLCMNRLCKPRAPLWQHAVCISSWYAGGCAPGIVERVRGLWAGVWFCGMLSMFWVVFVDGSSVLGCAVHVLGGFCGRSVLGCVVIS